MSLYCKEVWIYFASGVALQRNLIRRHFLRKWHRSIPEKGNCLCLSFQRSAQRDPSLFIEPQRAWLVPLLLTFFIDRLLDGCYMLGPFVLNCIVTSAYRTWTSFTWVISLQKKNNLALAKCRYYNPITQYQWNSIEDQLEQLNTVRELCSSNCLLNWNELRRHHLKK